MTGTSKGARRATAGVPVIEAGPPHGRKAFAEEEQQAQRRPQPPSRVRRRASTRVSTCRPASRPRQPREPSVSHCSRGPSTLFDSSSLAFWRNRQCSRPQAACMCAPVAGRRSSSAAVAIVARSTAVAPALWLPDGPISGRLAAVTSAADADVLHMPPGCAAFATSEIR
jgi:hypothetical protein